VLHWQNYFSSSLWRGEKAELQRTVTPFGGRSVFFGVSAASRVGSASHCSENLLVYGAATSEFRVSAIVSHHHGP
jgi:hypothetical protein